MRKIVVTVAPVCHPGKPIPEGCANPLTPEAIAEEVANCARTGASMVHLALSMVASVVRDGFEDSFYQAPGHLAATNVVWVEKLVALIRFMGIKLATPAETRQFLGLDILRS